MIRSFHDKDSERLGRGVRVLRFQPFERVARRRLLQIDAATSLHDLRGIGLSLEALKGDRKGQHAIRINDAWRICFIWNDGGADVVEIVNYH
jgi:toxin HigB-1